MTFVAQSLRKELKGRVLYDSLDFRVAPGTTLAVRGASGAGKSQLLRHLAGLDCDSPSLCESGSVTFRAESREDLGPFAWRSEVCFVPQHVPRLEGTPAEFVRRVAGFRAQRARSCGEPRALAAEWGLDSAKWEEPWSELSVGECQRALLAALFSRRPGVLLLDEPTAALDSAATRAVEASLRDQTCVWVTHSDEQATRVANDVLQLGMQANAD